MYNNDDDDGDGVVDYDDGYNRDGVSGNADDSNPAEDDLAELRLSLGAGCGVGRMRLSALEGGNCVRLWSSPAKGEGNEVTLPAEWPVGQMPSSLWVEGVSPGQVRFILEHVQSPGPDTFAGDRLLMTVVGVDMKVFFTALDSDDYVPKRKLPEGGRPQPVNTPAGYQDAQGEHYVPMEVKLLGPSGFSCRVRLTDTGGGDISIRRTDGTDYPAEGVTMTVGDTLEVWLYGETPSSALEDVVIHATGDESGVKELGNEDLTVIWVEPAHMYFRGSDHQGEPLTPGSTAKITTFYPWAEDKVGQFIYHKPEGQDWDAAFWQMELRYQISPDIVISGVAWDIKREVSAASWGPGVAPRPRAILAGASGWDGDDQRNDDEDLVQNASLKSIFEVDGPGPCGLPYVDGYGYALKAKFRDWVEVRVGNRWYVCSPYTYWRAIMHIKYQGATSGWVEDTAKTNEVVPGTISGFAGSWDED